MEPRVVPVWAGTGDRRGPVLRILVVEDDRELGDFIVSGLAELGHVCELASSGRNGLFLALEGDHDLVILDRMLPELDGLAIVKSLRAAGAKVPVLFLTNMSGIDDRVEGLQAGADDYLLKPFAFSELAARIVALSRRPPLNEQPTRLLVGDLSMDLIKRTVHRGGRSIDLQPREFRLLEFLMRHEGQVVTRTMLLEHVWDFHFDPKTNIVETHISRLRSKIDRGFGTELIKTFRGSGYALRAAS